MAAGLGFKTFTTGEVLTAGDVNGYLMQGINVFASSAARASAITSPQEGQYSFLKDTNALEYYDGAAWVGAPVGDITAVTAGTGISGGGSSGAVTITNDMATTITASGDIVVGTGSGTYDNLPIGTTGQILTADTTVSPYKVKWASAAGGTFNTGYAYTTGNQDTNSVTYTGLTTATAVTVTTGTKALVTVTAYIWQNSNSATLHAYSSFAVSGATTLAAADERAAQVWINTTSANSLNGFRYSGTFLVTGLTAGSNTFTMQYRNRTGEYGGYADRSISVVDLGS